MTEEEDTVTLTELGESLLEAFYEAAMKKYPDLSKQEAFEKYRTELD